MQLRTRFCEFIPPTQCSKRTLSSKQQIFTLQACPKPSASKTCLIYSRLMALFLSQKSFMVSYSLGLLHFHCFYFFSYDMTLLLALFSSYRKTVRSEPWCWIHSIR